MPKVVDREEMQHGILDAAMQVYVKKGYHAATIADVAEAAGLGKGTLYLYFKNKDAIAIAMVERHFKGMEGRFMAAEMPQTLDAFARGLTQTMNIPDEHARFIRVFFEVFGPSFASDAFSDKVADFFDRLGKHYAAQVAHLQSVGEIREDADASKLGRALAGLVDGMILHKGLFSISSARYGAMRREAIDMFMRGLAV
ncbi:MAG: TetR/AcrR family transcriptional regulator [Dinoroseobacter sp.]|nr:TetR/AcrR family transcriptional regulator [Dinoroseobacter sp.]MDJ0994924.1 TetR/AcrR family transcriptional regulator [Dinoroseobacter sp.]